MAMYTTRHVLLLSVIWVHGFALHDAPSVVDSLSRCWNETCTEVCSHFEDDVDYFLYANEDTEANVTLHCTDENFMMINFNPGTYIIKQSNIDYDCIFIKLVKGNQATFENLTAGTNYRYLLYTLTSEGISRPETSEWFSTYEADYEPLPVKNVSLLRIEPSEKSKDNLWAEIVVDPAEDRSCSYEVLAWNGKHHLMHFYVDGKPDFQIKLPSLGFDQNNSVSIKSVNRQRSKASLQFSMTFCTSTCLEYYYNDLTLCPPMKVEGLRVEHTHHYGEFYDLQVYWDESAQEPDNYTIEVDLDDDEAENHVKTVAGNQTQVSFSNLKLKSSYEVSILAESLGGTSESTSITGSPFVEYATISKFYRVLIIVISTTIPILAVIVMTCLQYYKQKSKRFSIECARFEGLDQKDLSIEAIKKLLSQSYDTEANNTPLTVAHDKFELSPKFLKLKGILGSGAYGIVRLGSLQDEFNNVTNVAVKMLKDNPSLEDLQNFHKEILIMKSAGQHPNIVSLIGCCILQDKPVLVVEFCCKGDLQTYLRTIWQRMVSVAFHHRARFKFDAHSLMVNGTKLLSNNSGGKEQNSYQNIQIITNRLYDIQEDIAQYTETVTAGDLLNFARQIATGMEFLSSNRIVHRDLAARNILVCQDRIVKISDFGLSRDVYQENLYRKQGNGKLPLKWMAIEALTHQIYTTHSDVWSFGILLWEIVTMGALPYPGIPTNAVLKLLKSGYRMERPLSCSVELYNIMFSCWNVRPQSRPTFTQLKESLDKLLSHHSDNKYLNMDEIL